MRRHRERWPQPDWLNPSAALNPGAAPTAARRVVVVVGILFYAAVIALVLIPASRRVSA